MVVDAVIPGADEVKLLCSLHEVVISDEVMVSYVTCRIKMRYVFGGAYLRYLGT